MPNISLFRIPISTSVKSPGFGELRQSWVKSGNNLKVLRWDSKQQNNFRKNYLAKTLIILVIVPVDQNADVN